MNRTLWGVLLALSCGPTTVSERGLSTSCTVDTDCVAVFLGDVCGHCRCPTAAIASSSQSAYDAELEAALKSCGGAPVNTCLCTQASAHCSSGTCTLARP